MNLREEVTYAQIGGFDGEDDIHVYPIDDIEEHNTESRHCWCNPIQNKDEPRVIVHNRAKDNPQ